MEAHAKLSIRKARILIDQKRYQQAESFLREALATEPRHIEALSLLVNVLTNQHRDDEALAQSEELLSLLPTDAHNFYQHGHILIKLLRPAEAEEFVREAVRLDPQQADFFYLLAHISGTRKAWEEGLQLANEGLSHMPDHQGCLRERIRNLAMLKRKQEMNETIGLALNRYPESAYVQGTVGCARLEHGHYRAAKRHFREALRIDPHYEPALNGLKAGRNKIRGWRVIGIAVALSMGIGITLWKTRAWVALMDSSLISTILIVTASILGRNLIDFKKSPGESLYK